MKHEFSASDEWQKNYLDRGKKETDKRLNYITRMNVKCKYCGHTVFPTKDRVICTYCGRWAYRNAKAEFKYKVIENMRGKKK